MYAQLLDNYGGTSQFRYAEVDTPVPGSGEVLVRNAAIGVNAMDWKIRSGAAKDMITTHFPAILGMEIAGTVAQVGDDVTAVAVGDRVVGRASSGAYAEFSVAQESAVTTIPEGVDFDAAVTLPVAVDTVNRFSNEMHPQAGQTVVVNGASGGVGTAAVQLLRDSGLAVIGTTSAVNLATMTELGAAPVVYGGSAAAKIQELAQHGVDLVFDVGGHGFVRTAADLTGDPAKVLTIVDFAAAKEIGAKTTVGGGNSNASEMDPVLQAMAAREYRAIIDSTHSLKDVAAAQERSEDGHVCGKIIMHP